MSGPFKMKGWGGYQGSPMTQKQEHEGKKTIGGERLGKLVTAGKVIDKPSNVKGGTDYYYTMQDGKYKIHGAVSLEKGKVIGVPGTKGGELTRS
jgi:hypothetical protein